MNTYTLLWLVLGQYIMSNAIVINCTDPTNLCNIEELNCGVESSCIINCDGGSVVACSFGSIIADGVDEVEINCGFGSCNYATMNFTNSNVTVNCIGDVSCNFLNIKAIDSTLVIQCKGGVTSCADDFDINAAQANSLTINAAGPDVFFPLKKKSIACPVTDVLNPNKCIINIVDNNIILDNKFTIFNNFGFCGMIINCNGDVCIEPRNSPTMICGDGSECPFTNESLTFDSWKCAIPTDLECELSAESCFTPTSACGLTTTSNPTTSSPTTSNPTTSDSGSSDSGSSDSGSWSSDSASEPSSDDSAHLN